MHRIDTPAGHTDASQPATNAHAKRSALTLLVICSVVGIGIVLDRATAHSAATIHDPRPPLMAILAVALGCIGWRSRDQLTRIGQAGLLLCLAGATSNLVCLLTDPDGVSDYLHIQAHGLLLVFNLADIALIAGAIVVATSIIDHRLTHPPTSATSQAHSSADVTP